MRNRYKLVRLIKNKTKIENKTFYPFLDSLLLKCRESGFARKPNYFVIGERNEYAISIPKVTAKVFKKPKSVLKTSCIDFLYPVHWFTDVSLPTKSLPQLNAHKITPSEIIPKHFHSRYKITPKHFHSQYKITPKQSHSRAKSVPGDFTPWSNSLLS